MSHTNPTLQKASNLMIAGTLIILAYAVVFFIRGLIVGEGFEVGVTSLNGVTPADLNALNPAVMAYITHLHLAVAGFIAATSAALLALCFYGVRAGYVWAWSTSMIAPAIGLAASLPKHYMGEFDYNWITHLGPVYLGTSIYLIGGIWALKGLKRSI